MLVRAEDHVGRVDAVVFPEASLQVGQATRLAKALTRTVIAGEGQPAVKENGYRGSNSVSIATPVPGTGGRALNSFTRSKHHRWELNASQVSQYGLGGRLDPTRDWWERIEVERRWLQFFTVTEWLTFCVLICEDLAQQEPAAEVIRAVGPNLVIGLLMDGPQLIDKMARSVRNGAGRGSWGCSVLTVTSLGMARLSRVPGSRNPTPWGYGKNRAFRRRESSNSRLASLDSSCV